MVRGVHEKKLEGEGRSIVGMTNGDGGGGGVEARGRGARRSN